MIAFGLSLDLLASPRLLAELGGARLPSLWASLALSYVGMGAAIAWHLGRRGHGLGAATTALACWPLLLGLVGRPAPSSELRLHPTLAPGPNRARIEGCIAGLRRGLADELGSSPALIEDATLERLAQALHAADHRIARVDRLLRETRTQDPSLGRAPGVAAALRQLGAARDHAAHELEAVLAGLVSVRVQLGIFALAGESEPVRERLAELEARVAALAELSSIELAQVRA